MLHAKGGRERLESIRTMEQVRAQHLYAVRPWLHDTDTRQVVLMAFPDRFWQWFDGGTLKFGVSVVMYNSTLKLAYSQFATQPRPVALNEPNPGNQPNPGRERDWEQELIWLNYTKWLQPEPVRVLHGSDIPRGVDAIETRVNEANYFRADFISIKRRTCRES